MVSRMMLFCGKVVVATDRKELPRLEELYRRATRNGVEVKKIGSEELRLRAWPGCMCPVRDRGLPSQPHLTNLPSSFGKGNGDLQLGAEVKQIQVLPFGLQIECAFDLIPKPIPDAGSLHCDRIAKLMGVRTGMRIVPIKGEYV